jgi:general secretion pathway protein H
VAVVDQHTPRQRREPRAGRGFTLLEMLVVIVLAGILLSIVSISVTPDERQELGREARRIGQLLSMAAEESRIRQTPIVWEADLHGYRFVTDVGGERSLLTDDLLRERRWERELRQLALYEAGRNTPTQVLLGRGAPPLRIAVAREFIQSPWRLEIENEVGRATLDVDEAGHSYVVVH